MSQLNQQGFTLIEILIYTVIFAIVGGMLTGILINATKVEQRESASAEVTSQLNFVMQTIQRLVRESSNIEIEAGTATSTLKLRMKDSAKDPTYITLSGDAIKLQEGSSATTTLTSDRVVVNTLSFKKFTQYPGHDTVSIDLTMTYNTQNTGSQVQRTLSSAIARVSAATFDADVVPGGTYNYNLGQAGSPWQKIIMADGTVANPSYTFGSDTGLGLFRGGTNILGFTTAGSERMRINASGNVGIGTSTPSTSTVLTVTTPNGSTNGLLVNGPGGSIAFQDRASANGWLWYSSGDIARFKRGDVSGDLIGITTTGLVGVGTTTPASLLDVTGTVQLRGYSTSTTGLYVNGTGNVGIGTTGPNYLLETNGMANAGGLLAETINVRSNLLSNGGFEGAYSGGIAPNWSQYGIQGTFVAESTVVHNGAESQKITVAAPSASYGVVRQSVSLTNGSTYQFSAWLKCSSGACYMRLKNNADTIFYWAVVVNGTGWQRVTKLFQATATENALFLLGSEASSDVVYIDDASIAKYDSSNIATGNSTFAVTVDGNVGIGTSTPAGRLHIVGSGVSGEQTLVVGRSGSAPSIRLDSDYGIIDDNATNGLWLNYFSPRNVGLAFGGGNVGIGTATPGGRLHINYPGNTYIGLVINNTSATSDFRTVAFRYQGTEVGSITTNSANTAYNTSSDARLKENIKPTAIGLDLLNKIQVRDFNFINDPQKVKRQGYIAQELYQYYPEAVTVGGDNINNPWGVDYGRLTPLIVKSVQELAAKTASLVDGDVYITTSTRGIILTSPDGTCARGTIDNSNALTFRDIACP